MLRRSRRHRSTTGLTGPEALAALQSEHSADLASLSLDGSWGAMIASPWVGAVDSHRRSTPFSASDILSDFRADQVKFAPTPVVLLEKNDFGQASTNSHQLWITMVLLGESSEDAAQSWCETAFGMTGESLMEYCIPRQLSPPTG